MSDNWPELYLMIHILLFSKHTLIQLYKTNQLIQYRETIAVCSDSIQNTHM